MAALRGVVANNLGAPLNALNLVDSGGSFYAMWGDYFWNPQQQFPCGFVAHLYYVVPPASEIQALLAHPAIVASTGLSAYRRWICVGGNEPNTEALQWWTPQWIDLVVAQIDAFIAQENPATPTKFALTLGSQLHAPGNKYGNPVWIDEGWTLLPQAYKDRIKALHTHFYAGEEVGATDSRLWNKALIKDYINDWQTLWLNVHAPGLPLWLTEIGLPDDALAPDPVKTANYPNVIQQACVEKGVARWYWYGLENVGDVVNLWTTGLTPTGVTFANLG